MTEDTRIQILKLRPDAQLPTKATSGSIGYDIRAYLVSESGHPTKRLLPPRVTTSIPTGIALKAPTGRVLLICSRGGLAQRSIFVPNAPGIVDEDYTGEIFVLLYNGSFESHWVEHGQRIAQIMVIPLCIAALSEVSNLSPTERGDRGFGSTGP
jgi:dUTP pyrophosphatase